LRTLSFWPFINGGIEPLGSESTSGGRREPSGPEPVEGGEFDSRCGCQKIPSLRTWNFFIQAAGLVYYRRSKCVVYHQPLWGCISSRTGVYFTCGSMIYKAFRFDDMQFLAELMRYTASP